MMDYESKPDIPLNTTLLGNPTACDARTVSERADSPGTQWDIDWGKKKLPLMVLCENGLVLVAGF